MITCDAFLHTGRSEYKINNYEHPITIQLAGFDPKKTGVIEITLPFHMLKCTDM